MSRYIYMDSIEIELEEEIIDQHLGSLIRKYGFEHIYVRMFADYMEYMDFSDLELAYDILYNM